MVDNERALVGAILLGQDIRTVLVEPSDFANPQLAKLWDIMLTRGKEGKPNDPVLVDTGDPQLELLKWECQGFCPTAINYEYYAAEVLNDSLSRKLRETGEGIIEQHDQDPLEVISALRVRLDLLLKKLPSTDISFLHELPPAYMTEYKSGKQPSYPTGLDKLDEVLGGFRPGALYIVGARPGIGKSVLGLTFALSLAKEGVVSLHSLEMPKKQLVDRALANICDIPLGHLINNQVSDDDLEGIEYIIDRERLPKTLAIIDKPGQTLTEIRRYAMTAAGNKKLSGIVVDYLQLMREPSLTSPYERVTYISNGLKGLAMDLKCPVIALAQLNRQSSQREDSEPVMSDLRDSGAIEQDADVIMLLNRAKTHGDADGERSLFKLEVAKNRHGMTKRIAYKFNGRYSRIERMPNA